MGGALAGGMGTDDIPLAVVPITFPGGLTSASSLGVDGLVGLDEWGLLPPSNVVYGTPDLNLKRQGCLRQTQMPYLRTCAPAAWKA